MMEEDTSLYPTIEPTNFDLIVVGTGLPESILAAAASAAGKTVLQLDPNPFYGSHFASLSLDDFTDFLHAHSQSTTSSSAEIVPSSSCEFNTVPITTRPVYSCVEVSSYSTEVPENSRKFVIDLVGPRILFCADKMIDLILKSGIYEYMEFRNVDGCFMCENSEGCLSAVPNSRSAIFKDKNLSFIEKNQLMRFFKLVQGHFENVDGEESKRISEEDLEIPFAEFLSEKIQLPKKLKSIILYAIAMADYDQENSGVCKDVLKTKDGLDRLILYHSSVGRFNAPGGMIYPTYGQGELPQAFCRRAAVKGCLYVLRMPIVGLLTAKDVQSYRGVKLVSGQELFGDQLILAPSFIIPLDLAHVSSCPQPVGLSDSGVPCAEGKVVRGICVTKNSLKPDMANCLVFCPPQSLFPEQLASVRIFQLSSNAGVCPSGMFVIYLSAVCDDVLQGKKILKEAINALFSLPTSEETRETSLDHQNEIAVASEKPSLLWSATYIQDLTMGKSDGFYSTPMPDATLQYNNLLDATKKLFEKMYPGEEFFPKSTSPSEDVEEDAPELSESWSSENPAAVDEAQVEQES